MSGLYTIRLPANFDSIEALNEFRATLDKWNYRAATHAPRVSPKSRIHTARSDAIEIVPIPQADEPVPGASNRKGKGRAVVDGGGLRILLSIPLDVLHLIADYLHPTDLVSLASVSKDVRKWLLCRSEQERTWNLAIRNVPDLPPRPEHMSQPRYVALLFGKHCFACGTLARKVNYALGWRLCAACFKDNIRKRKDSDEVPGEPLATNQTNTDPDSMEVDNDSLPSRALLSHPRLLCDDTNETRLVYGPEIDVFHRYFIPVYNRLKSSSESGHHAALQIMIESREAFVEQCIIFAEDADEWLDTLDQAKKQRKDGRREEVRQKLIGLGYTPHDIDIASTHRTWNRAIFRPKNLTQQAWERTAPILLDLIHQVVVRRQIALEQARVSSRLTTLANIFQDHLCMHIPPHSEDALVLPSFADSRQIPALVQIAHNPGSPHDHNGLLDLFHLNLRLAFGQWFQHAYELRQHLYDHHLVARLAELAPHMVHARLSAPGPQPPLGFRRLAAAVFVCSKPHGGWQGDPVLSLDEVFRHWRQCHPHDVLNPDQQYEDASRNQENAVRPRRPPTVTFFEEALGYIRALGLPDDITMGEMDALVQSGRLQCPCRITRNVKFQSRWTWCMFLTHVHKECTWNHEMYCDCNGLRTSTSKGRSANAKRPETPENMPDDHRRLILIPQGEPIPSYNYFTKEAFAEFARYFHGQGTVAACTRCIAQWRKSGHRSASDSRHKNVILPSDPSLWLHHLRAKHGIDEGFFHYGAPQQIGMTSPVVG
ncbi:hypothetical protein C8Q78DRAFT_550375 [Trametes maxima]|nr:hypothetical protein C8Q78DRAFT_550375 [Trametes maxima]